MMRVLIRADASTQLGFGHIMRCLSLSSALRDDGHDIRFACCSLVGNLISKIEEQGFQVELLPVSGPEDFSIGVNEVEQLSPILEAFQPDLVIVDHYGIDAQWHRKVAEKGCRILVIDDMANRTYHCEWLLDQTYGRVTDDYRDKVNATTQLLLGSEYALLRPQFAQLRQAAEVKRRLMNPPRTLLLSLGGTDSKHFTSHVVEALLEIDFIDTLHVVLGAGSSQLDHIQSLSQKTAYSLQIHHNIDNMAELMLESDLAIGAAGTSSWERATMGLPTLLMVLADNQEAIASALVTTGAAEKISLDTLSIEGALGAQISAIWAQPERLFQMGQAAMAVCDGQGIGRVINRLQADLQEAL